MANVRARVGNAARSSVLLLAKKLTEARAILLIQQRAIRAGCVDSLEASTIAVREIIAALVACKRVCRAGAGAGVGDAMARARAEYDATPTTTVLARLEAGVAELIWLQQQNRTLLVGWMERSAALLDDARYRHADIPNRSFPDQARNILIHSEI